VKPWNERQTLIFEYLFEDLGVVMMVRQSIVVGIVKERSLIYNIKYIIYKYITKKWSQDGSLGDAFDNDCPITTELSHFNLLFPVIAEVAFQQGRSFVR
jgi:hypothetical protein